MRQETTTKTHRTLPIQLPFAVDPASIRVQNRQFTQKSAFLPDLALPGTQRAHAPAAA